MYSTPSLLAKLANNLRKILQLFSASAGGGSGAGPAPGPTGSGQSQEEKSFASLIARSQASQGGPPHQPSPFLAAAAAQHSAMGLGPLGIGAAKTLSAQQSGPVPPPFRYLHKKSTHAEADNVRQFPLVGPKNVARYFLGDFIRVDRPYSEVHVLTFNPNI